MDKEDSRKEVNVSNVSSLQKKRKKSLNAGLDEVGMGCWAGPLLVVVTAFPADHPPIEGVKDSKKMTKESRIRLAPIIVRQASFVGRGWVHANYIDDHGMVAAWQLAASLALEGAPEFDQLRVDGVQSVQSYQGNQSTHTKGESKFWTIAAASVVAKVLRDQEMKWMSKHYPMYAFSSNKGYGTAAHKKQLLLGGPCSQHRMRFLRKLIAKEKPRWAQK